MLNPLEPFPNILESGQGVDLVGTRGTMCLFIVVPLATCKMFL